VLMLARMLLVALHLDLLLCRIASGLQPNQSNQLVELQLMSQLGKVQLLLFLGAELCMDAYRASFDLIIISVFHSLEEIKTGDQHQTMMGNERVKCF
jgi:hypothetical protein